MLGTVLRLLQVWSDNFNQFYTTLLSEGTQGYLSTTNCKKLRRPVLQKRGNNLYTKENFCEGEIQL